MYMDRLVAGWYIGGAAPVVANPECRGRQTGPWTTVAAPLQDIME
jgi:hypothetical protein